MKIFLPSARLCKDWKAWAEQLVQVLEAEQEAEFSLRPVPAYSKGGLPPAAQPGCIIYVPDETGGATLAFSDGSDWRRVTDRAVVS